MIEATLLQEQMYHILCRCIQQLDCEPIFDGILPEKGFPLPRTAFVVGLRYPTTCGVCPTLHTSNVSTIILIDTPFKGTYLDHTRIRKLIARNLLLRLLSRSHGRRPIIQIDSMFGASRSPAASRLLIIVSNLLRAYFVPDGRW